LGDLGDPAGAVALAAHLTNTGDVFRSRDQWEYPGATATNVPAERWRQVDYFVVDVAAADALLRLGVKNAAAYVIHKQLDPSVKNARIRVYQDATDALRRAFRHTEAAPLVANYNVDQGFAARDAAFLALAGWWHTHRDDDDLLRLALDETDAGFRRALRGLVDKLQGTDVRSFMITKPALEILGTAATPTLIEALQGATRGSARTELSRTLAMVRDPRAIQPLIATLEDRLPFVRAAAAESLGAYVHDHPAALAAVLATLGDRKPGPRVSALKALVAAPPSAETLAAVVGARPEDASSDWQRAETVFRFVQEGETHWPTIEAGLAHKDRHVREAWWRLLRAALDLPPHAHDPHPALDKPAKRRITRAQVLAALSARRSR
ncbi:MAG: HEAT repeat domain-containing protein, partial [Planctomycetota bacterium]|nr:HEAT repeat domain-containing protein [Planctomycetota bacterium]